MAGLGRQQSYTVTASNMQVLTACARKELLKKIDFGKISKLLHNMLRL